MMDYPALDALAAVVREGSFERAAVALRVTSSAVSQRIRGLEERVGAILVVRGQPCQATAMGARLCAHLEQVRLMEGDVVGSFPTLATSGTPQQIIRIAVNADSLNSWFAPAVARFAWDHGALLDLVLDDEQHTGQRLREGDVLAAITADPEAVQGCRIIALGALRFVATASPAFVGRYFREGVDRDALARAPMLRFDRRDALQTLWAQRATGTEPDAPTHWIPSTQAFLDLTLAGLGWSMNPEVLARPHIANGGLVELVPGTPLDVPLYWQVSRVNASLLSRLTEAVRDAAGERLLPV